MRLTIILFLISVSASSARAAHAEGVQIGASVPTLSTAVIVTDASLFARKKDLLTIGASVPVYSDRNVLKNEVNRGYFLAVERGPIRIWDTLVKGFPGHQPPIIQVLDEELRVLASKEVSDPCWMLNGRIHRMRHTDRIFVYIECTYRQWATPPGSHIFEITKDNEIKDGGIFWSANDLMLGPEEASKEARRRSEWAGSGLKTKKYMLDPRLDRRKVRLADPMAAPKSQVE